MAILSRDEIAATPFRCSRAIELYGQRDARGHWHFLDRPLAAVFLRRPEFRER